MLSDDHSYYDDYILDYFDDEAVLSRFNRDTGARLTPGHRAQFVRFLSDNDYPPPPGREPDTLDPMAAERFAAYIDKMVWTPLAEFLAEFTAELENPERFAALCGEFEATLKRQGVWHEKLIEIIHSYVYSEPLP